MVNGGKNSADGGVYSWLRSKYMFKIGAAMLVLAIVLVGIGYVTLTEVQASVQNDAEETLTSSAEREALGVEGFLEEGNENTRRISALDLLGSATDEEIREVFQAQFQRLPDDVVTIHYYDMETGEIQVSSDVFREGDSVSTPEDPWAFSSDTFEGTDVARPSDPFEHNGDRRLAFVSPAEAESTHAVVVVVDLQNRGELLTSPVDGGVMEAVSHDDGTVVLSQSTNHVLQPHPLADELDLADGKGSETQVREVSAENDLVQDEDMIVAVTPIEGKEWSIVNIAPRNTLFGTVDDVSQSLLLLIGVAILGLFVISVVITRNINKSLEKITGYAEEIESGNLDVEIEQSRADEFGQLSRLFERIRDTLRNQIQQSESARKEAEVARAEAEEMATYLTAKAEEYSGVMQTVGGGDLTMRMAQDGEEDSMDRIAAEFNDMIVELEKTTGQLKSYVDEVEGSSAEVEQSAHAVREASEQVADSIQKISDDAYTQKDRIIRLSETTTEAVETIESTEEADSEQIAEPLAQLQAVSEELAELTEFTEEMMAEAEQVAGAAEEQAAELNAVSERANDLQRYAEPLRDILQRFETEAEHEFVFSGGPTAAAASPTRNTGSDDTPDGGAD